VLIVLHSPTPSARIVLHVRSADAEAPPTGQVERQLATAGLAERLTPDLYHAMAWLSRAAPGEILAVFVAADTVGMDEWEFFPLAARRQGGPAVYVYGDERHAALIDKAVALGAAGPVSPELVHRLAGSVASPPPPAETWQARSPAEASRPSVGGPPMAQPSTEAPLVEEPELPEEPTEEEPGELESEPEPVIRVPWVRYDNRPERTRPGEPPPDAVEPEQAEPKPARRPLAHEPLLTEDELRALLGDDLSAVMPRRPAPDRSSGSPEGAEPP
jgi:hypothetical protein